MQRRSTSRRRNIPAPDNIPIPPGKRWFDHVGKPSLLSTRPSSPFFSFGQKPGLIGIPTNTVEEKSDSIINEKLLKKTEKDPRKPITPKHLVAFMINLACSGRVSMSLHGYVQFQCKMWEVQDHRLGQIGKILQFLNERNNDTTETGNVMSSPWHLRRLSEPDAVQFDGKSSSLITMYAFVRHHREQIESEVLNSESFKVLVSDLWKCATNLHKNSNFSYGKRYLAKKTNLDDDWLGAPWEETETGDDVGIEDRVSRPLRQCSAKDILHRDEYIALSMCFWRIIAGVNLRLFSGENDTVLDPLQHLLNPGQWLGLKASYKVYAHDLAMGDWLYDTAVPGGSKSTFQFSIGKQQFENSIFKLATFW